MSLGLLILVSYVGLYVIISGHLGRGKSCVVVLITDTESTNHVWKSRCRYKKCNSCVEVSVIDTKITMHVCKSGS